MTARWALLSPDRLDVAAEGHEAVAAELEHRALYFRTRAIEMRRQAEEQRATERAAVR